MGAVLEEEGVCKEVYIHVRVGVWEEVLVRKYRITRTARRNSCGVFTVVRHLGTGIGLCCA
jgi:hypothetical protein